MAVTKYHKTQDAERKKGGFKHFGGQPCKENNGVRKGEGQARQT